MKIISKMTLGLATAALLFVGCGNTNNAAPSSVSSVEPTISEDSLGLRKVTLYNEAVKPNGTSYGKSAAGSGYKIKRAFQDAPPMIPHDTEGMLPITINNNQCVGCHDPAVAKSMGATPYPISHMTDFRPVTTLAADGEVEKNGHKIKNTSSETLKNVSIKSTDGKLYAGRFNCSQCHAPQSKGNLAVENNFEASYTTANGASKSSWNSDEFMEGIDTTK